MKWINKHFYEDEWQIGIIEKPIDQLLSKTFFDEIRVIKNKGNYFLADPFILSADPLVLLAEKYDYSRRTGELVKVIEGSNSKITNLIKESFHLSFPNYLHDSKQLYILPESIEVGSLIIYSDSDFSQFKKLIDQRLLDPLLFKNGSQYYILGNQADSNHLKLYTSSYIDREWEMCLDWQFEGDNLNERCGGQMFFLNDKLIRPTQIHYNTEYGYGLHLNQIDFDFDKKIIRQEVMGNIEPKDLNIDWVKGIHTINNLENFTVIDLKRKKLILLNPLYKLLKRVKHLLG